MVKIREEECLCRHFNFPGMLPNFNPVSRSNTPFSVKDILNLSGDTFFPNPSLDKIFMDTGNLNCNNIIPNSEESYRWGSSNIETSNDYESPVVCSQNSEFNVQLPSPSPSTSSLTSVLSNTSVTIDSPLSYCTSPVTLNSISPDPNTGLPTEVRSDNFNVYEWNAVKTTEECDPSKGINDNSNTQLTNGK